MKLKLILTFILSFSAFSQGLIWSHIDKLPDILVLEKQGEFSSTSFRHSEYNYEGNLYAGVNVVFNGNLDQLERAMNLKSSQKFFCKGEYEFGEDDNQTQTINFNKVKMCIDQLGKVIVYSRGLSDIDRTHLTKELKSKILIGERAYVATNVNNSELQTKETKTDSFKFDFSKTKEE